MIKFNKDFTERRFPDLEYMLSELTTALSEQTKHAAQQTAAMDNLTQAIYQLDATIKDSSLKPKQPSEQLKDAISSFMESSINRQYYQKFNYFRLKSASSAIPGKLEPAKQEIKSY